MMVPPPTPNSPLKAPAAVAIAPSRSRRERCAAGRADEARVSERVSVLLGQLARSFGLVACVSGRSAADARRLVGVGGIAYAGSHGAELLEPGAKRPAIDAEFKRWEGNVKAFVTERDTPELRRLRVRIEDKGPIAALHWRGVPDEDAARERLEQVAGEAEQAGLAGHLGGEGPGGGAP